MRSRTLCWVYGGVAAGALVVTWSQNIRFFGRGHDTGLGDFISDSYANAAAASISNDLVFLALAAFVLMAVEARRLGIRRLWMYFVLSFAIVVSVAVPLFLLARERRLAELGEGGA